jgi:hypothetical protein
VHPRPIALVEADRELREVGWNTGGEHRAKPIRRIRGRRYVRPDEFLNERRGANECFLVVDQQHVARASTYLLTRFVSRWRSVEKLARQAIRGKQEMLLGLVAALTGLCFAGAVVAITIGLGR